MYSLLCELAGTLVLGVTEEFDDTALVWCESIQTNQLASILLCVFGGLRKSANANANV